MAELRQGTEPVKKAAPAEPEVAAKPAAVDAEALAQRVAELEAKLNSVADAKKLHRWNENNSGQKLPVAKVSYYKGLPVVAWKTVTNEVYKDQNGIWHENQIIEVTTTDGQTYPMQYMEFVRIEKREAVIENRKTTYEGHEIAKMMLDDGSNLELDITFLN